MTTSKILATSMTAIAIIAFGGYVLEPIGVQRAAIAETVFLDDFQDGDIHDDDPISWGPAFNDGQLSVADGSLVLTGSRSAFATMVGADGDDGTFADTSIQTQVRLLEGDNIGIAARWNNEANRSYGGFVETGVAGIGIGGSDVIVAQAPIAFDVKGEDVKLQLDVIGDTIRFGLGLRTSHAPLIRR